MMLGMTGIVDVIVQIIRQDNSDARIWFWSLLEAPSLPLKAHDGRQAFDPKSGPFSGAKC